MKYVKNFESYSINENEEAKPSQDTPEKALEFGAEAQKLAASDKGKEDLKKIANDEKTVKMVAELDAADLQPLKAELEKKPGTRDLKAIIKIIYNALTKEKQQAGPAAEKEFKAVAESASATLKVALDKIERNSNKFTSINERVEYQELVLESWFEKLKAGWSKIKSAFWSAVGAVLTVAGIGVFSALAAVAGSVLAPIALVAAIVGLILFYFNLPDTALGKWISKKMSFIQGSGF